jgi:DNA-binding NtrC family response regulator
VVQETLNGRLCKIVDELVFRGVTLEQGRREFEKQFLLASLRSNDGNVGRSAKSLGIHRNTLRNMVHRLEIDVDETGVRSGRRQGRR